MIYIGILKFTNQLLFDLQLKDIYNHIQLGPIIWNAGSLHIYPSQFNLIK